MFFDSRGILADILLQRLFYSMLYYVIFICFFLQLCGQLQLTKRNTIYGRSLLLVFTFPR